MVPTENATNLMDSKETVLQEVDTTRSLINRICKCQRTFLGHVIRKENQDHLVTTGMMKGKRRRRKQGEKMLNRLTKWLKKR